MSYRKYYYQLRGTLYFYLLAYTLRDPLPILSGLVDLVTRIILFIFIGGLASAPNVLLGSMVSYMFGVGFMQVSVDFHGLSSTKFKNMLVSSPVHPLIYAFGAAVGMSLRSFLFVIPLFALYSIITGINSIQIITITLILVLTWIIGVCIGFILPLIVSTMYRLFAVTKITYAVLVYLVPVYYPLELLPQRIRVYMLISPISSGVYLIRVITNSIQVNPIYHKVALLSLSISTFIGIYLIKSQIKWRQE